MLTELRIQNFAIIQELELKFGSGLIAFTGETGAGKSILLDAIQAILGGKTDATFVRSGAERAAVEAVFRIPESNRAAITELLESEDLLDDPQEVILSREVRREGRSTARINGRAVSLSLIRDLGALLVDIHGQSDHLSLLNYRQHIRLLDQYADCQPLLTAYRKTCQEMRQLRRELDHLRQAEKDAARRTDLLQYQVQEIDSAGVTPAEEDELKTERTRLSNSENLATLSQQAILILDEGDIESVPISEQIGKVVQALASISRVDPAQAELYNQAETAADLIAEIARDLRDYLDNIEFNPRRLEQIEERLDLIHRLKRKYGGSVEAMLAFAEQSREELDTIAHATERIAELEVQETTLLAELARQAGALSARRKAAAEQLSRGVEAELADLRMPGARFSVDFQTEPDEEGGIPLADSGRVHWDETGYDRVEFLIAPNPGEGLKPLVKIASGGETSRLMLALKKVLAGADAIPTLIFDEIDQGISGRVGTVVGEKLWQLGRAHQVLCVTHLPQLAAFGDQHYSVRKQVHDGRTSTVVTPLDAVSRVNEMAHMLGAASPANLSAAQETLEYARKRSLELAKTR